MSCPADHKNGGHKHCRYKGITKKHRKALKNKCPFACRNPHDPTCCNAILHTNSDTYYTDYWTAEKQFNIISSKCGLDTLTRNNIWDHCDF